MYELAKLVKLTETESRMVVSQYCGRLEMGSHCLNEYRFLVLPDKESSGYGLRNHMNVFNATELNLKMVKMINFRLHVFYPPI